MPQNRRLGNHRTSGSYVGDVGGREDDIGRSRPSALRARAGAPHTRYPAGRWEESTAGLEKAVALDPRSPELLESLADNYTCLRRYRDAERMHDRLIVLKPDEPLFRILKATNDFREKGELKSARAAYEALPSSVKDDSWIILKRVYYAMCDLDWAAALELVNKGLKDQIYFAGEIVPRRVANIWTELLKGEHPTYLSID